MRKPTGFAGAPCELRQGEYPQLNSARVGTGSILNSIVEDVGTPTNSSPGKHSSWFDFRLLVGVILLVPAIWFSWKTIDGLAARRVLRTDLAEITHARYGILSADQWRAIIGPMLNAQVDKLDLKGQSKSLRPMVERSLYALLDNITQLSAAGSRLATENVPNAAQAVPVMADRMRQSTEAWRKHGFDVEMTDLWYGGDRNDVVEYLGSHGWDVSASSAAELVASHGLSAATPGDDEAKNFAGISYVTATRR